MEVKSAWVNDLPGMKLEFDVVVEGEIEITEGNYRYDDYDVEYLWFILNCTGDLANNLDNFQITASAHTAQKAKCPIPYQMLLYQLSTKNN